MLPHNPIIIASDADFNTTNGVTGGDGSLGNPWVISGWSIDGGGITGCIYIASVTQYFVIENCTLTNAPEIKNGINLWNLTNGRIRYNTIEDCWTGVGIWTADNIIVENNVITNAIDSMHSAGINLAGTQFCQVANNTISYPGGTGIWITGANNILSNNSMTDCGILISIDNELYWNSNDIDTTNTVNSKPIYYVSKSTGFSIPSDAGQVIIASSTGITGSGMDVSGGTLGLSVAYSSDVILDGITSNENSKHGISIFKSNGIELDDAVANGNSEYGLIAEQSDDNGFIDCEFSNNFVGIGLSESLRNTFNGAKVTENEGGISDNFGKDNTYAGCNISYNGYGVISMSEAGTFDNCTIAWNDDGTGQSCGLRIMDRDHRIINSEISHNNKSGISLYINAWDTSIIGTTISNNYQYGIMESPWHASINTSVSDSLFQDNGYVGLQLNGGARIENTIFKNNNIGLIAYNSSNTIMTSLFRDNQQSGISLANASSNNINNCSFIYNSAGISIGNGDDNTITHCIFRSASGCGVYCSLQSANNLIYHNNFYEFGTANAQDESPSSHFDCGYPVGGNFWFDYYGSDLRSGVNQTTDGMDGIGDEPYMPTYNQMGEGSVQEYVWVRDGYPLMNPVADIYCPWDDAPPSAEAGEWITVAVRVPVRFDASNSTDEFGIREYDWSFDNDGTNAVMQGKNPSYTFQSMGEYTVTLNVTDFGGFCDEDFVIVRVLTDFDHDEIPDETDTDDDDDGVLDYDDDFPFDPSETMDSDEDGIGDVADTDDDDDGILDADDAFPLDPSEFEDSDGDHIGNNADPDDDNDGVPDEKDKYPLDSTKSKDDWERSIIWIIAIIVILIVLISSAYFLRKRKKGQIPL